MNVFMDSANNLQGTKYMEAEAKQPQKLRAVRVTILVPDEYQGEEPIHPHLFVEDLNIHSDFKILDIEDTESIFSREVKQFKLNTKLPLVQKLVDTNIQDSL